MLLRYLSHFLPTLTFTCLEKYIWGSGRLCFPVRQNDEGREEEREKSISLWIFRNPHTVRKYSADRWLSDLNWWSKVAFKKATPRSIYRLQCSLLRSICMRVNKCGCAWNEWRVWRRGTQPCAANVAAVSSTNAGEKRKPQLLFKQEAFTGKAVAPLPPNAHRNPWMAS